MAAVFPDPPHDRDPLFALLAVNGIAGALLGLAFVAGAVWLDIGHLRRLVDFSSDGIIALLMLSAGSIITFGSVAMGSAVMMLGRKDKDDDENDGHGAHIHAELVPAITRARR